ncbi:MAG TPA: TIGR03086 family metal-binding protein [Nocardioidaceae bacterium]|nr:TIGR03086 family metal-binding protein [Nocardioidaceae bacterium]
MADRPETAVLGGVELLERAIGYTHGSLQLVSADLLNRQTPCRDWNLRDLLEHMADSLVALSDAAEIGRVDLEPCELTGEFAVDIVRVLHERACRLLGAWTNADTSRDVAIGDQSLMSNLLTSAGALEVAVHGWDVARACGHDRPIPAALAEELLEVAPVLVTEVDRVGRFAARVPVSPLARPSDLLTAYLGRR